MPVFLHVTPTGSKSTNKDKLPVLDILAEVHSSPNENAVIFKVCQYLNYILIHLFSKTFTIIFGK